MFQEEPNEEQHTEQQPTEQPDTLLLILPEDPAYSTPDVSNFFFFSGRYVRDTMCNSVFFFNFFGSIFTHLRPGHRPQKIFNFFSKKFDISNFWIFFLKMPKITNLSVRLSDFKLKDSR